AQGSKYTTDGKHHKGLQNAGGNKVVMSDKKGEQTILLSNSNNKSTAVKVSFAGDGSVHIQSSGPVTVNGSVITLDAGAPGEGQTAFTGAILMRAKTITMEAEEQIDVTSVTKSIALKAEMNITADAKADMILNAQGESSITSTGKMEISSDATADISGTSVKING
ncbi:MAG TPA: hypothetical protein VF690_14295, partial [Hymenobacter sp.]